MNDTNPHASGKAATVTPGRLLSLLSAHPIATLLAGLTVGALATFGVMSALQANEPALVCAPAFTAEDTRINQGSTADTTRGASLDDGPSIAFNSDSIELGRIPQDETVEHILEFSNTGGAELTIDDVSAT